MPKQPKKRVPRTRHTRQKIAPYNADTEPGLVVSRDEALKRFNADFCHELPQDARTGQHARDGFYTQVPNDKFDGKTYPVPDGAYRVAGSDWVFVFEGGGFVEALRATPANEYGGRGVIAID